MDAKERRELLTRIIDAAHGGRVDLLEQIASEVPYGDLQADYTALMTLRRAERITGVPVAGYRDAVDRARNAARASGRKRRDVRRAFRGL